LLLLKFKIQIVTHKSKIQLIVSQEYLHTFSQLLMLVLGSTVCLLFSIQSINRVFIVLNQCSNAITVPSDMKMF